MRTLLNIQIDRFISDHQPGVVECSLVDADGERHVFHEKVSIVTTESLGWDSAYPAKGSIECFVEGELTDSTGRNLLQISTELPWHVASTSGATRFLVQAHQVQRDPAA